VNSWFLREYKCVKKADICLFVESSELKRWIVEYLRKMSIKKSNVVD